MARRKAFRARARSFGRSAKRYGKRTISGGNNPLNVVLPAAAYGAARGYLSNLAQPITSKIPLGNYADEALFGLVGYYIAKKNPMGLKNVGMAMLTVEAASIGNQLVGSMGNSQPQTVGMSSSFVYK
jgi:hypothetical protein